MPIINGQGRVAVRVTGGAPAPSSSYLLDTYGGAAAAYSLRKLSSTYSGSAIRVRRSSDNTEMNIGFDGSGNLDTTALTSFVGAGNGFVTTWYDQSGNNKNAVQTTAANQPQIVTSGVVETKNGKPNLRFLYKRLTVNQVLQVPNYITFVGNNTTNTQSIYAGFVNYYSSGVSTENPEIRLGNMAGGSGSVYWGGGGVGFSGSFDFLTNKIHTLVTTPGITMTYYGNNTQMATGTRVGTWANTTYDGISIGGNTYWGNRDCDFQEFIIYNVDQSSNRTSITSNINTYYSIYSPMDSDAQSFITAASITDSTQASAVNTLVTSLKSAGIWTKMKAIYPFVGGTASSHKFNLKDPRDLDAAYRLVFNGGWTHSSTGAQPNGTTGYANTKLAPSSALSLNSASFGFYGYKSTPENVYQIGTEGGFGVGGSSLSVAYFDNFNPNPRFVSSLNGGSAPNGVNTTISGMYMVSRASANSIVAVKNTTTLTTGTSAAAGLSSQPLFIGSYNSQGWPSGYSNTDFRMAYVSDGLTTSEMSTLYTAVQAFQTTLGRQVA